MAVLAVVNLELFRIVGDAISVIIILDGGADSFLRQHGTVNLVGGQTVQRLNDGLIGQLQRLADGLALDKLSRHGAGSDRAAAAEGVELAVGDDAVLDLYIHAHDVAALGIADLADTVSIVNLADIAGMLEMIHNLIAVKCHN